MNHDYPTRAVSTVGEDGDRIERAMRRARYERSMVAKTLFLGVCGRLTSLAAGLRRRQTHPTHGLEARP